MISEDFGHWVAGFIAGEGCFRVHKGKKGHYYACHFTLKLRDDDFSILEEIVSRVGVGHLKPDLNRSGNSNPCLVWVVHSKKECQKLVKFLDQFPLRARKALDYIIWRKAVAHWNNGERGTRWLGPRDWAGMRRYKEAIEQAREYPPHQCIPSCECPNYCSALCSVMAEIC